MLDRARGIVLLWLAVVAACGSERRQALEALGSRQAGMRVAALDTLAKTRDPSLRARIVPFTRDPVARVRRAALAALAAVGVGKTIGPVVARLEDSDVEVRLTAVRVLGTSGRPAAKRVLLETLDDRDMIVRRAAQQALERMGLGRKAQRRDRSKMRLDNDLARLAADDEQVRATAARDLGASGRREAEAGLIARAKDPSPLVLAEVAVALATLGGSRAHEALGQMARAQDANKRAAAARGLGRVGDFGKLIVLAKDREPRVRLAALSAAARASKPPPAGMRQVACEALLEGAGSGRESEIALAAARSLGPEAQKGCAGLDGVLEGWKQQAESPPQELKGEVLVWRCKVAGALQLTRAQIALASALYELHRREAKRWVDVEHWEKLAMPTEPEGAAAPPSKKPVGPHQRRAALQWLLGRYRPRQLGGRIADPLLPPAVDQEMVGQAIAELAPSAAAVPLLAKIATEAPAVLRVLALERIATLEAGKKEATSEADKPPTDPLGKAVWLGLRAKDTPVRLASMRGCQHVGAEVLPQALDWLRSGSFGRREAAAICVGRLGVRQAVPVLMEVLAADSQLSIVQALARIGDKRATFAIARLLSEDHPASRQGERVAIIEALEKLGDASAVKYLARELSSPTWPVRLAAARALRKLGAEGARKQLDECVEDYRAAVREACKTALLAGGGE